MATTIGPIILDGTFTDWLAADSLMNSANTVAGYQIYGALIDDPTLGENYVIGVDATASSDAVIAPGTVIYLNTDQSDSSGYSPFGAIGAEYEVQFAADSTGALQAYLYSVTAAGVTTPLNGGLPLASGFSSNGESVELAIPQALLKPSGGAAPTAINFDVLLNNSTGLPVSFDATTPQYVIPDPAAAPAPTTIGGAITLDGTFTDWPAADSVVTPGNTVAGYQVYGAFLSDATLGNTYVIGIDATNSADPVIGAGSTIYLNTDQNATTGYQLSFANVGAEYEVQFVYGPNSELEPFLYSVTAGGTGNPVLLNNGQPLSFGMSSDGKSVELAIPQSLLIPAGGSAPTSINFAALLDGTNGLPGDLANNPEYTITDPATLVPVDHTVKKVGIVYSATSAALYFGLTGQAAVTAYDDLFMDAQHQAEAAGVSYDILTEADLTNVAKLSQYSALIFPDFQDVQSSQVSAISSALSQVVYNYHVPIITGGEFMTNDETGAPLPGNPFASMTNLLNVTQSGFGTATYSVTPDATALANNNPVLAGFTSGELIGGASGEFPGDTAGYYTSTGYLTFSGVTQPATTLADINIQNGIGNTTSSLPGVVQTTTGGTNTVFATTGLEGDSNLLQHAIQNAVFGATPSLTMDITRFKGVLNSRTDMDQSQFPSDVDPSANGSPAGTPGIYDVMIPILQSLEQQYDFVGSYYINIGDDADPANGNMTNWSVSSPYYDDLLEMGNEIGTHSYTHLIAPPTTTVTATTSIEATPGSTQITVSTLPSYNGATVGMVVTDASGDFGPNTIVSAVSGNATTGYVLTLLNQPAGFGTTNEGVIGDVKAGTAITFGIPTENTNFLGTGTGPFTYNYEFGQSAAIEGQQLGITIAGAAVPGATEVASTSDNIEQYFQTANLPAGLTGYLSGGWTGVGSGSPNAFGYIDPSDTGSVYIAPNITFDFSELQYENKTPAQSLTDWETLFNQMSANSATPIIVWPWHDYGITDWPTDGVGTAPPGYTSDLYSGFIADAYDAGYEFVTTEDLASRIAAEQAATLKETTSGNVITATVTPAASEPDLGAMALNVINGAAGQVIQNAGSWYAYDSNSVFMPYGGGAFTVTLGTTQDDVTHVDSLPMRADLRSVSGDGSNLTLAMTGDGTVDFHVKTPGTNIISIQTSIVGTEGIGSAAPTATLVGDDLQLAFDDGALAISSTSPQGVPVLHNVTITEGTTTVAGATFVFNAPPTIAGTKSNQQTTLDAVVNPFTGVTIGDLNTSAMDTLTITLSNSGTGGTLADGNGFSGLVSKGAGVYTLSGTAGTVTNELDALLFTPAKGAQGSTTTTTFTLSDLSSGYATPVTDNATTVTDTDPFAPTIVLTHATTTTNDAAVHPFTGVTIGDLNPGATDTLTITLSNSGATGKLSGTGLTGGTNGVYTLTGAATAVTSELDLLTFTPVKGATGSTTITTFALSDLSSANATAVSDSATTVTDIDAKVAPTITGTTNVPIQTTFDAQVSPFTGVTITDVNAGATDTLTITLSGGGKTGTLAGAGLTIGTNGNYTLKGTAAAVTSALDALIFTPAKGAAGSITTTTFTLSDQSTAVGPAVTDKLTTVTDTDANVAPTIANTHATQTTSDAAVNPFTGVTIGDLNGALATDTLTITLSSPGTANGATGTLSGKGLTGGTNGVYTLTKGTAASVTSALQLLSFKPATGAPGSITTTTFTLSDLSSGFTTPTSDSATTVTDTDAASGALAITSGSYATSWILGGTAPVGSTVTVLSGATTLGTVVATTGSWTFTTKQNNSAIRTFTVATNGITSAPYIEGTTGNDTFSFASEAAVSAAALINGGGGTTDTLKLTAAATLTDADFAHAQAIEILGLTGASSVTLGPNASAAGIKTVTVGNGNTNITDTNSGALAITATALPAGSTLTLAGTSTDTVTGLVGNLSATGDSGALTVTATGTGAQNIATGSGNISIADSAAGSVTVDATALGTNTLTLTGTAAKTVNNLAGNVVITGAAKVAVNANGSGPQSVTTGNGATTIVANGSGAVTVNNANAKGTANTLTLSGTETETVNSLAQNLVASGLSGALNVTTTINGLSITPGTGTNTINAGAMTGTLTLIGSNAATVTAMGGNLNASTNSGTISVTTTGAAQSVTTGSGATTINDTSTGNLKVTATALAAASTLTLTGAGAATVTGLKGNLDATGDSGTISVTATGTGQTVNTGSGNMTIADSTSALTVNASALSAGSTLTLSGSTAKTVSSLQGNLATSGAGPINVTATGSGPQSITTSTGADTITDQTSGGDTIHGGGGADNINVSGHPGADSFTYSATSDSRNTTTGHDTITGFSASDLLDFSALNANLHIGTLQAAGSQIAADSIAWVNLGASGMGVYVNDGGTALATTSTNANLMEISLAGASSRSASNFRA
jgi:hypothetical protein